MVYVTGDFHGDLARFQTPQIKKLRKTDTLIICGDFGFVWSLNKEEQKALKWIGSRKFTTLFVEGTHENFELLETFPEEAQFGGTVRRLGQRLFQLKRGEIYEIEGKKFFAFGGGGLDEDEDCVEGVNWYVGEEPSKEDMVRALTNLEKANWTVDYIVSHDTMSRIKSFMLMNDDQYVNMNTFFDEIGRRTVYRRWFFGHYHVDKVLSPSLTAVYKEVISVD